MLFLDLALVPIARFQGLYATRSPKVRQQELWGGSKQGTRPDALNRMLAFLGLLRDRASALPRDANLTPAFVVRLFLPAPLSKRLLPAS